VAALLLVLSLLKECLEIPSEKIFRKRLIASPTMVLKGIK